MIRSENFDSLFAFYLISPVCVEECAHPTQDAFVVFLRLQAPL